jgi:uncharacterized circularly permuted ATP-grasp superfamily protein
MAASFLGVPVVGLDEARGRLPATVWYRTAEDRLRDDAGDLTPLGELLLEPLLTRSVRVVNRPGCGVLEDKRLLIGAPQIMRAVSPSGRCSRSSRPGPRPRPVELRRHVYKTAHGAGGRDVAIRPQAPVGGEGWVAQRHVPLSTHPTLTADGLVSRPVDLRAFAVRGRAGWRVLRGGVSRFPTDPRTPVVNTSKGGGIKDVWVLDGPPRPRAGARGRPRGGRT